MKTGAISERERRTIMIGALVLAPFAAFLLGVRPYRSQMAAAQDRLATERDALARERGAIATAHRNPELQHQTDSVMQLMAPLLFEGRDDVMATSELASYLGDVARTHHLWLQDAATRPATSPANGVRVLHVEIRGESDVEGVMAFLQALDNGDKLVRVEQLDITRTLGSEGNDHAETVSVAATISGYALGPSSAPASSTTRTAPRSAELQ
ncbi:MAG TPA: type II secretion system protein GspM [Gemmatimonadales bacterium]|jgi:hypothetical protein|nr:type II secretion system protein GspM [Gemmatimonadales bacterium]